LSFVANWKKSIQNVKRGMADREQELDKKDQLKKESIKKEKQIKLDDDLHKTQIKTEDELIDTNLKAIDLEKSGNIERAVKLYEFVIKHNFIGNGPYDRLSIIYRKNKDFKNEIRVLKKAIYVFENIVYKGRSDRLPKLEKFKTRLDKTILLKEKGAI